jgi:hypothetical protein
MLFLPKRFFAASGGLSEKTYGGFNLEVQRMQNRERMQALKVEYTRTLYSLLILNAGCTYKFESTYVLFVVALATAQTSPKRRADFVISSRP